MELFDEGLGEYPRINALIGNFFMLVWIVLGTIACWLLYPPVAWFYFVFSMTMVYIVLRKLVCTNCYYYDKWCCIGWGKLSALFFKKGDIEKFAEGPGIKVAPFVYGSLTLVPLVFLVISMFSGFAPFKLLILVLLLLVGFYSSGVSRKKSCANCRMRLICPGSAVK